MVMHFNMDLETRMANMYKSLVEPENKVAEERKALSPDEFWKSMRMVAMNNQVSLNYNNK